jgi:L-threonylcarbamoyladenylate synthase
LIMLMQRLEGLLSIPEATARLTAGQAVIFPTDTVWGIGAKWTNERGVKALYQIKRQPIEQALAILVAEIDQLRELGLDFDRLNPTMHKAMVKLMKAYWPGGLTLVLPWPAKPDYYGWPSPDLGVRVPNHPVTQALLRQAGPLLQSSANVAGGLAPASYEAIDQDLVALTGGVVAGESGGEAASTVVNLTGDTLQIVRAGCVPVAEIEKMASS